MLHLNSETYFKISIIKFTLERLTKSPLLYSSTIRRMVFGVCYKRLRIPFNIDEQIRYLTEIVSFSYFIISIPPETSIFKNT